MRLPELDPRAVLRGTLVALVVAVPFAVVGQVVLDPDTSSGWGVLLAVGVLFGLLVGGFAAAREQRVGAPLAHGIVAALAAFAAVQVLGIARRLVAGDDIRWGRIVSSALLSLIAGTLGGLLASRAPDRPRGEAS